MNSKFEPKQLSDGTYDYTGVALLSLVEKAYAQTSETQLRRETLDSVRWEFYRSRKTDAFYSVGQIHELNTEGDSIGIDQRFAILRVFLGVNKCPKGNVALTVFAPMWSRDYFFYRDSADQAWTSVIPVTSKQVTTPQSVKFVYNGNLFTTPALRPTLSVGTYDATIIKAMKKAGMKVEIEKTNYVNWQSASRLAEIQASVIELNHFTSDKGKNAHIAYDVDSSPDSLFARIIAPMLAQRKGDSALEYASETLARIQAMTPVSNEESAI